MIRVLVADSQLLLAQCLERLLNAEPDLEVVPDHPNLGLDVISAALKINPDVTVMDYDLLDMAGPAATRLILARAPRKILLLGWFQLAHQIGEARKAGAVGFISKDVAPAALAKGIRTAHDGTGSTRDPKFSKVRSDSTEDIWERLITLTPREIEILGLLSQVGRSQHVAKELGIRPGTMRTHLQHILSKTGARSQMGAVSIVRRFGLI